MSHSTFAAHYQPKKQPVGPWLGQSQPSAPASALLHPNLPDAERRRYLAMIAQGLTKTSRTTRRPQRVIVIGAGMAGLSAAYELLRAGHDPVILEAAQRVGGRCYTLRQPFRHGLYAEAGAMRFPATHELVFAYINQFQLPVRKFTGANPNGLFFLQGQVERMGDVLSDPTTPQSQMVKRWEATIAPLLTYYFSEQAKGNNVWPEIVKRYHALSLHDFLRLQGWNQEEIELLGAIGVGRGGLRSVLPVAFLELFYLSVTGSDKGEYQIIGGTDQLPNALLTQTPAGLAAGPGATLQERIHYGAKVTAITQTGSRIRVHYQGTAGAAVMEGDYAITTIPFPRFRQVSVTPRLSPRKAAAIRELNYVAASKIFLQCKSRFWEKAAAQPAVKGMIASDLPVRISYFPDPTPGQERAVILASYTWGEEAATWSALSPTERIERAVACLAQIYPDIVNEVEVGASCVWDDSQPFAGNAFCLAAPGQQVRFADAIRQPEGRLHFAGEHTAYAHGWVEGAIESGLRCALAIHESSQQVRQHQPVMPRQQFPIAA